MSTPLHRSVIVSVLLGIFGCVERTGDPILAGADGAECSPRCAITGDSASAAVTDAPGNASASPLNLQVLLAASPVVRIANLLDRGVVHSGFVIGTASDPTGVTAVRVTVDGAAPVAATLAQPGAAASNWSFKLPTGSSTWRDGTQHTISVVGQGGSGTTAPVSVQVRKGVNQDVNGDGYADAIVGAWAFGNNFVGRAYIFQSRGASGIASQAAGSASTILRGRLLFDSFFGWSVTLGDVNGDGYADAIVGAPQSPNAGRVVGRVYVFHSAGSSGVPSRGTGSANTTLSGEVNVGAEFPDDSGFFGGAVAAGDVNGDGYADVAVAAQDLSDAAGRAYVFHSAGPGGVASRLATAADTILPGETSGDQFGSSLAIGDVNGDHFGDVVIGAWQYSNTARNGEGRVYVFQSSGTAGVTSRPGSAADTLLSSEGTQELGQSVAVGDVNGDGFDDVAAGAQLLGRGYVFHSAGATGLVSRSTGSADTIITPVIRASFLGRSVSLGDVNGDGFADLAVGELEGEAIYLFHSAGPGGIASAATPAANTTLRSNRFNGFGNSVALTDITGDGYMDVLDGEQINTVTVFHSTGAPGVLSRTSDQADTKLTSEPEGGDFGFQVF